MLDATNRKRGYCGDTRERVLALERIIKQVRRITVSHMMEVLYDRYGIVATRKVIGEDIAALTQFMPIEPERVGKTIYYRLLSEKELKNRYQEETI